MSEDFTCWRDELQAVLEASNGPLRRVVFFRATDSTQDAARRMGAQPGDVVIAGRQTAGRGRLGRPWADTQDDGVAVTMVLVREEGGRLAIAGAIAAAHAAEAFLACSVGIKWPNDVIVNDRKLAGILVEQVNDVALVGIGLNVNQTQWLPELADRAVSLRQLDVVCDRLGVLKALLNAANAALAMSNQELADQFASRDVLIGTEVTFYVAGEPIVGTVLRLDPLHGLLVGNSEGEHWLAAATTSLSAG